MSLLGEVAAQIVGELIGGLFGLKKPHQPLPEGATNASFGAVSAFFGSLGLIFGLLAAPVAVFENPTPEMSLGAMASVAALGFTCSYIGLHFGREAPHVTRRHLGMVKYGFFASIPGALLCVVALVACAARIFI